MRKFLYFTVFVSGMASLAMEMAASRLLANVFGTSNLVWASIIGLILIYLSAGYFLGGFWTDRSPNFRTFFKILLWAGVSTALIPVISRPVLRLAANAFDMLQIGILLGAFVSVMILMVVPITLLGSASPFAIRLALDENGESEHVGKISGRIYAISTLGSFIGTFLPVLILIPLIGTYQTFIVIGAALCLVALIGFWRAEGWRYMLRFAWVLVLLPGLSFFGLPGQAKNSAGMIYEVESAYNYIQVIEYGDTRYLRLNEGQGVHSVYDPTQLYYAGPWEQVLVAPLFNRAPYDLDQVKRMAIVGLAAGTTARQASVVYPQIVIDGYEIDPKIVDVGREYFDMDMDNLNVFVEDGRWGLKHSPHAYQVISVDAYRPPYIPPHLTTREFFGVVYDHLAEDGVMVINIGRAPNDRSLIDALGTTIQTVFPSVYVMDLPDSYNSILFATKQATTKEDFYRNLADVWNDPETDELLRQAMMLTYSNLQDPPETTIVFTDDKSPIEWMTNQLIVQFMLSEGEAYLQ
ncbi:MAG: fused MFS/spermidine synthase [Anaerolineaceae bacterium]|nr:fused MFS/spermidine synthase [Anaerolineaceae bacterium]